MKTKSITGNPEFMREINKKLILNLIRDCSPISRSELSSKLNLALPTVMRLVDSLIGEELVREVGKGDSSGGRKPVMLEINNETHYIIGVEVCRFTTAVITDFAGNIIARCSDLTKGGEGPEASINQVISMIDRLLEDSGIARDKIMGVGIGTPGTNFKSGELIEGSVFKGWQDIDIESLIKSKIEFPVVVENIARVLAIGELYFGAGNGIKNFISVFADYGTGSGIVINGDLYRGRNNVSGEFGHTVVRVGGKKCYCGNNGCVEMYTSIPSITDSVTSLIKKGRPTVISDRMQENSQKLDFQLITEALAEDDELALQIIKESGYYMGIGVANLINLYNPDMVIMNGEVCVKCDAFIEAVKETVMSNVFSQEAQDTPIVVSRLGEDAGALGAAAMVMRRMFKLRI